MHLINLGASLLLTSAYWLGAASLALPEDDVHLIEGKLPAHYHGYLDLDEYEARANGSTLSTDLEKRTKVRTCMKRITAGRVGACAGTVSALGTVAILISNQLKSHSDNNDCSVHYGSADGISWQLSAMGRNCDTTAQAKTIQGSLDEYIESVGSKVCGVACLRLDHGGTYRGYVTLAAPNYKAENYYCGANDQFGGCVKGGKEVSSSPRDFYESGPR